MKITVNVEILETLQRTIEVEVDASSKEEAEMTAIQKVRQQYKEGSVELDWNDCVDYDVYIER